MFNRNKFTLFVTLLLLVSTTIHAAPTAIKVFVNGRPGEIQITDTLPDHLIDSVKSGTFKSINSYMSTVVIPISASSGTYALMVMDESQPIRKTTHKSEALPDPSHFTRTLAVDIPSFKTSLAVWSRTTYPKTSVKDYINKLCIANWKLMSRKPVNGVWSLIKGRNVLSIHSSVEKSQLLITAWLQYDI